MYRLLKVRSVPVHNKCTTLLQTNLLQTTRVCSFCSFYHPKLPKSTISYLQQRRQTTTMNTVLLASPSPKKVKRQSKAYAELLEVSGNMTSNRKATIRNLNTAQLSLLVDKPEITLDQLHKIKSQLNHVNNQTLKEYDDCDIATDLVKLQEVDILNETNSERNLHDMEDDTSIMEDLQASGIADQAGMIKNSSLLQTLEGEFHKGQMEEEAEDKIERSGTHPKTGAKKKIKQKPEKVNMQVLQELNNKAKQENFDRYLLAYLKVCLSCGMITRAYQTLMHYRKTSNYEHAMRSRVKSVKIVNVALYNVLLRGYAELTNVKMIQKLWSIIKEDSIKPTPQTYAAVFEVFGRLEKPTTHSGFLRDIHSDMEQNGITFNDVVTVPKYFLDQKENVMKTIKFLQPDFEPAEIISDYSYSCRLLNKIDVTAPRVHPSPAEGISSVADLRQKLDEQVQHEVEGSVTIKSIDQVTELSPWIIFCRKIITDLEATWTKQTLEAFDRNLAVLKHSEDSSFAHRVNLYPFLTVLDKEEYVKLIISTVRKVAEGSETFSPSLVSLHGELGKYINEKYKILEDQRTGVLQTTHEVYSKYCEWYLNPKEDVNTRIAWQKIAKKAEKNGFSLDAEPVNWPSSIHLKIGKFLYDIILKDIKLDINCVKRNCNETHYLPAFYTLFRTKNKRLKEEIKPHPVLSRLYRESQPETLTFTTSLVPSVCPPKPWSTIRSGGYIIAKTDIIRVPFDAVDQWSRMENVKASDMWPALDSLNQLASIPWKVNEAVLDVILKVFREGGSKKLNVPQPPSVLPPVPQLQPDCEESERINVTKARITLKRLKGEMYSLWCDLLYRLSLANHFRDKIFWLPHNMDFRGRVYPIPPHLNHLGSDLARSILVFAQKKPLGPEGLNWLKIHTINLTGLKKRAPIGERLEFANENMDKILESAENPLTGKQWWAKSDNPWQTLAACMEIAKAVKAPDPEKYMCNFPIHQDGSCNGLQHYAALGRDQIGAENVNLHPFDTPQDVYSSVAAMVDKQRQKDAEAGLPVAKILEGFVARKVIKQTVMTTVYGVTKFGARLQIARQLEDLENFPQEHVWLASIYLVQLTWESLRTMFESAREIQDWFTECARVISINYGKNVEWVTPLGLPIVQPYTKLQKPPKGLGITELTRPNTVKQKNAFPPNFVHSLDSSHMMLTSLHCENTGVTFMSVHDCYWTHACTVEPMNQICREQFVAMHSEPILEDLSSFLLKKYCTKELSSKSSNDDQKEILVSESLRYTLSRVPKKGTFDLQGVLNSVYFFS